MWRHHQEVDRQGGRAGEGQLELLPLALTLSVLSPLASPPPAAASYNSKEQIGLSEIQHSQGTGNKRLEACGSMTESPQVFRMSGTVMAQRQRPGCPDREISIYTPPHSSFPGTQKDSADGKLLRHALIGTWSERRGQGLRRLG